MPPRNKIDGINGANVCGECIRTLRTKKGMSQDTLAAKMQLQGLDLCRGSISRIENGERVVADFELLAFATALGTTPNDLLGI